MNKEYLVQKFFSNRGLVVKTIAVLLVFYFIVLPLLFGWFKIINPGEVGVVTRLGNVSRTMYSGLHLKIPFIENVTVFNVQTSKEQVDAQAASKDLQTVNVVVAVNYHLDEQNISNLFRLIGDQYKEKIIDPAIQEAVKASTANYTAEELITKREVVRQTIQDSLTERLKQNYVDVTGVSIVDFNFSPSFNQAIEAKVTAEQNALAAKNKLEQVKYEAEQRVEQAKGEAEAIKIQTQAIQSQGGRDYVNLKAIEKWNGELPQQMMGGAVPFVNITPAK